MPHPNPGTAATRLLLLRPAPKQSIVAAARRIIIWRSAEDGRSNKMFAVIFEVEPKAAAFHRYLDIAGSLRPELERIDGFVAIERFRSRRDAGHVLSLSLWRDEAAIGRWRGFPLHRAAQQLGRSEIFADYRLRVGEIAAEGAEAAAAAGTVTITERSPSAAEAAVAPPVAGVVAADEFDSLAADGKRLLLVTWRDAAVAAAWRPEGGAWRHRRVRIVRDYGMFERAEAPQYYPPLPHPG
jgi:heme-degrading monooxygenase HmoA